MEMDSETTTISVARLAHLQALESNITRYLTATRFPDIVLAKLRLQRMLGTKPPKELDEMEAEWTRRKAEVDSFGGRIPAPQGVEHRVRTRTRAAV